MASPLIQQLNMLPDGLTGRRLAQVLTTVYDRLSSQITASGGLAIKTASSALARTANTVTYVAGGVHGSLAAGDMPALTGLTITANRFNVAVFYVNAAGTTSVKFGTEGATAGAVKFPEPPVGSACIGYLLITHSSTFTGGTTALDTATTVYVNTLGPFDPTATV